MLRLEVFNERYVRAADSHLSIAVFVAVLKVAFHTDSVLEAFSYMCVVACVFAHVIRCPCCPAVCSTLIFCHVAPPWTS